MKEITEASASVGLLLATAVNAMNCGLILGMAAFLDRGGMPLNPSRHLYVWYGPPDVHYYWQMHFPLGHFEVL